MTTSAYSPLDVIRAIGTDRFAALTDAERAELERLQAEINETVARIQSAHAAYTPKTSAWTDEERADMAARREADNAGAYEFRVPGLDRLRGGVVK